MLADFGLSRMKHDLTDWSSTGNGYTVQYVSPEVVGGSNEITVSSDIWSLGMVVLSAFTGKLPYEKNPMPLIEIIKATPPQRPLLDMTHKVRGFTENLWNFLYQGCWAKTKDRPPARKCSNRLTELKAQWLSDKERMSEVSVLPTKRNILITSIKKMIEGSELSARSIQPFNTLRIQICVSVTRQYARNQSTLYSKKERFNIELEVHEGSEKLKVKRSHF